MQKLSNAVNAAPRNTVATSKKTDSGVVTPLSAKDLNERAQVDLVDMQTMKDGKFCYVMHHGDYLKFYFIRTLSFKRQMKLLTSD